MKDRIRFFVNEHIPMMVIAVKKSNGKFREVQMVLSLAVSDSTAKKYEPSWVFKQSKNWREMKTDTQLAKWIESLEVCGTCGEVHGDDFHEKKKPKLEVIDTK